MSQVFWEPDGQSSWLPLPTVLSVGPAPADASFPTLNAVPVLMRDLWLRSWRRARLCLHDLPVAHALWIRSPLDRIAYDCLQGRG